MIGCDSQFEREGEKEKKRSKWLHQVEGPEENRTTGRIVESNSEKKEVSGESSDEIVLDRRGRLRQIIDNAESKVVMEKTKMDQNKESGNFECDSEGNSSGGEDGGDKTKSNKREEIEMNLI